MLLKTDKESFFKSELCQPSVSFQFIHTVKWQCIVSARASDVSQSRIPYFKINFEFNTHVSIFYKYSFNFHLAICLLYTVLPIVMDST